MPDSAPLVLLPGLQSDHRSWVHQIRYFEGRRPVLVPRGHQFCSSVPEMADNVVAQLPERFHLVAWSMGGYIAFQMLPQIADRLISLVLVATTARPESPDSTTRRLELIAKAEREGVEAASVKSIAYSCRDIGLVDPAARDGVLQSWIELGVDAYRRQQHAIINRPDGRPNLALVTCPTTVVVGDSDQVTPQDCAEELCDLIAEAALRVIPECGHCPPLEFPDLVNAMLDDWLTAHQAPVSPHRSPSTAR